MPPEVLTTKLFVPSRRSNLVSRPRLLNRIAQGSKTQLTLVSAPAGAGKTTLLCEYLHASDRPVAWISLDEKDNDPTRFLTYLVTALQNIQAGTGRIVLDALYSSQPADTEELLTGLTNELAGIQRFFILVLDDYHVITNTQVQDILLFVLNNQAPSMHLIVSTRADPPWPLARMRASGKMIDVRTQDLRFSLEETTIFLNDVIRMDLPPGILLALESRTDGWIAGLQMAAISMQGRTDIDSFVRSFTGSNRFIFDYLIEEVLERLPHELQDFLLQTSILERMCGPLCDTVTGSNESQTILSRLEGLNLFIIPLDDQRRWYRYHHLFNDLLQQRLGTYHRDQIYDLHKKACRWYQENGLIADAIHHALIVGDLEQIANLVEGHIFEAVEKRELFLLSQWLENLSNEERCVHPWLSLAYAWTLDETLRHDEIEHHLQNAEASLQNRPDLETGFRQHILSHIAAIRARLALKGRNLERASFFARRSLTLLPESEKKLSGFVASLLGSALWGQGELAGAARAFYEGIAASIAAGDLNNAVKVYGDLAGLLIQQGQLHRAYAVCQEALEFAQKSFETGGRLPRATSYIHFRLSSILRHWNDLSDSLWHAQKSVEINEYWGLEARANYINLASALYLTGDLNGLKNAIEKAEAIASKGSSYWIEDVKSAKAVFALTQGNLDEASQWALENGLSVEDEINHQNLMLYMAFARLLVARVLQMEHEPIQKVEYLLSKLRQLGEDSGAVVYIIQVLILQALVADKKRDLATALRNLREALTLAEPGGYIRVFIEDAETISKLLQQVSKDGISTAYIEKIATALNFLPPTKPKPQRSSTHPADLLTDRELEVLQLLSTSLTSNEIAEQLTIAVSTVRTHIKRIYAKLNVHNRIEAIDKADECGLL